MLAWLLSVVLLSSLISEAETKVPCLIFSGNAEKEHCIDLASLNKITFGDNSMVISPSKSNGEKTLELQYALYHHLEFGDAVPTGTEAASICLSQTSVTLKVGETLMLTASVLPNDATDKTVTWSSDNESVVRVDAGGNVTALAIGKATIKAQCGSASASCFVTVDDSSGIETVHAESDALIYIDAAEKLLYIKSRPNAKFNMGVFNAAGYLLLTSELVSGDAINLESLLPGVYIAVASDGITQLTLKFTIN